MSAKKTKPARGLGAALAEAGVKPETAYKAPKITLVPDGLAAYAADVLANDLGSRAVKNFAYLTREAAEKGGFKDFSASFTAPLSVKKNVEVIPQIRETINSLVSDIYSQRSRVDHTYITFGIPKGEAQSFGPVTVGCTVTLSGGQLVVTFHVFVLAHKS